jgi:hypothetical protein
MTRRQKRDEPFATAEAEVPYLLAGQVAKILDMDPWRLQKFLNGKRYRLKPEGGQLGKGQGSRRLFNHQDIYRLGIAYRLVRDGFAPDFVSRVLQEIEDHELLETDSIGQAKPADIGFWRTADEPRIDFVSGQASVEEKKGPYYVLRLKDLLPEIDAKIVQEWKGR